MNCGNWFSCFFTEYKDALITGGWLIAVVGWFISNNQANQREKRKETRAEIDAISAAMTELLAKCRVYYTGEPSDAEDDLRSAEIAFDVKRILVRVERLHLRVPELKVAVYACAEFFDAVTGEHFQSKARAKFLLSDKQFEAMEFAAHYVNDSLEDGFSQAFNVQAGTFGNSRWRRK